MNRCIVWDSKYHNEHITHFITYGENELHHTSRRCRPHRLVMTSPVDLKVLPNKVIDKIYRNPKDGEHWVFYTDGTVQAYGGYTHNPIFGHLTDKINILGTN